MIGPSDLLHPSPSTTFQNLPGISHSLSKVSKFQHQTKLCSKCSTLLVSFLNLIWIYWWKVFFLLTTFTMAILDLISYVHLASFIIMLPKQLKYFTFSSYYLWSIIADNEDGCLEILITSFFPHSFPIQSTFQMYSVYYSFPYYSFFLSHYHKVLCIFHSANYSSYLEVSKPFGKSFLGWALAA